MRYHQRLIEVLLAIAVILLPWDSNAASAFTAKAGKEELNLGIQDGQKLRALVQKPSGDGPFPVIIVIHGSGGMRDDYAD